MAQIHKITYDGDIVWSEDIAASTGKVVYVEGDAGIPPITARFSMPAPTIEGTSTLAEVVHPPAMTAKYAMIAPEVEGSERIIPTQPMVANYSMVAPSVEYTVNAEPMVARHSLTAESAALGNIVNAEPMAAQFGFANIGVETTGSVEVMAQPMTAKHSIGASLVYKSYPVEPMMGDLIYAEPMTARFSMLAPSIGIDAPPFVSRHSFIAPAVAIVKSVDINDTISLQDTPSPAWPKAAEDTIDLSATVSVSHAITLLDQLRLAGQTVINYVGTESVESSMRLSSYAAMVRTIAAELQETVDMGDISTPTVAVLLQSLLGLQETLSPAGKVGRDVAESLALADNAVSSWIARLTEALDFEETLLLRFTDGLYDSMAIAGEVTPFRTLNEALVAPLGLSDSLKFSWLFNVSDEMDVADAMTIGFNARLHDTIRLIEQAKAQGLHTKSIADVFGMEDAARSSWFREIADAVDFQGQLGMGFYQGLSDVLGADDTALANMTFARSIRDSFALSVEARAAFNMVLESILDAADSSIARRLFAGSIEDAVNMEETAHIKLGLLVQSLLGVQDDTVQGGLSAVQVVQEVLKIYEQASVGFNLTAASNLDTADDPVLLVRLIGDAEDSLDISPEVFVVRSTNFSVESIVDIAGVAESKGSFGVSVQEAFQLGVTIIIDDEAWECFVLNTSRFQPSIYTGYNFNSFCNYQGRSFAAGADGIYEIGGTGDNGTEITTGLILSETDFAMPNRKRFRKAYLGVHGDSPAMGMVTDNGDKIVYQIAEDNTAHASRSVSGKRWVMSVVNFEAIDFISLVPVVLTRGR